MAKAKRPTPRTDGERLDAQRREAVPLYRGYSPRSVAEMHGPEYEKQRRAFTEGGCLFALLDVLVAADGARGDSPSLASAAASVVIPHWAAVALLAIVVAQGRTQKGNGKTVMAIQVHQERYDAVEDCRGHGFPLVDAKTATGGPADLDIRCPFCGANHDQWFDEYRHRPNNARLPWHCGACDRDWFPAGSCFRKAAAWLPDYAVGTPDTIRASWLKVRRSERSGAHWRYYRPYFASWPGRRD